MKTFRGIKRHLLVLMVISVPMAFSEPISISQEALFNAPHASKPAQIETVRIAVPKPIFRGIASWYSKADPGINLHTANGEVFDDRKMTCASYQYPFGTLLKVTNLANGKSVVCRVNDRGPNKRLGRLIDLTLSAFRRIAEPRLGLVRVSVMKIS
jgi:rare lipoprotein A